MSDLIDRQAAIDAFNTNLNELVVGGEENAKTVENYLNRVLDKIKCLPSAQLSTNLAEVGTDCISREQAIDALRKLREEDIEDYGCEIPEGFNQDHLDRATFAIKQLPPIQPKRGRWHYSDGKPARIGLSFGVICDQCGTESEYCTNFCPNCGAKMEVTT